jgi:hypothetical protein
VVAHARLIQRIGPETELGVLGLEATLTLMATSGRELALWFHGLQIRSHSSPDHGHHLSVFTVPYRGRGGLLRHGLYDHALVPTLILAWIKNDFDLSPADLDVSQCA